MTWTTFCNIFLFTSQSWDPKVRRVSLNEWELNRKLAHQNTSRLPNNRKRPCKLWALWQRRERALILTPWLKTFYCALQLTIELASLALKKQMLWVGRGLSPCQQIPLTMVHLEGKKKKKASALQSYTTNCARCCQCASYHWALQEQTGTRDWEGRGSDCVLLNSSCSPRVLTKECFQSKGLIRMSFNHSYIVVFWRLRCFYESHVQPASLTVRETVNNAGRLSCDDSRKQLLLTSLQSQRRTPITLDHTTTSWRLLPRTVLVFTSSKQ